MYANDLDFQSVMISPGFTKIITHICSQDTTICEPRAPPLPRYVICTLVKSKL